MRSVPELDAGDGWRKEQVALRETDRSLAERPGGRPLTVAFGWLGATAASWTLVEAELARHGEDIDRSGITGRVVETYPSAVRKALTIPRGWEELRRAVPWLGIEVDPAALARSRDAQDAVVCALAARARALGRTVLPRDEVVPTARQEGWIHVPDRLRSGGASASRLTAVDRPITEDANQTCPATPELPTPRATS